MNVKSAFLNGYILKEVYVEQPLSFTSYNFPNYVFKLKMVFYGLKQTPRAWYEKLSNFLSENGFKMGNIDTTLFIKTKNKDMFIVQYKLMTLYLELLMFLCIKNLLNVC